MVCDNARTEIVEIAVLQKLGLLERFSFTWDPKDISNDILKDNLKIINTKKVFIYT